MWHATLLALVRSAVHPDMPDGGPRAARLVVLRASNAQNFTHTERTLWHVSHLRDRLPDAGTRLPEAFCDTVGCKPDDDPADPPNDSYILPCLRAIPATGRHRAPTPRPR